MKALVIAVAGAAVTLAGAASAQQQQTQSQNTNQERVGAILGALFGDRTGTGGSLDTQWTLGRTPLAQQRTQFDTRIDTDVRAGTISQSAGARAKSDFQSLVALEAQYGSDRRFTQQERTELRDRYTALTDALDQGGYAATGVSGGQSVADGRAEFERRVDAAVLARRITRTQGTQLKTDYVALAQVEVGYLRDGVLSVRERDDLETRLDALDARVGDVGQQQAQTPARPQTPAERLDAVTRALPTSGLAATAQTQLRVEHEDLTRLAAAYRRAAPTADEQSYLERRIGELEVRARVRR